MNKKYYTIIAMGITLFMLTISFAFGVGSGSSSGGSSFENDREAEARSLYERGQQFVEAEDYVKASRMFKRAALKKPDFAEAYNMLGFSLRKSGKYEDAIEYYKKALEINAEYADAHEYIGEAYLGLGDRESAWKHYTILKRLGSDEAEELLEQIEEFDKSSL